jgi:hypothetical protein
MKYITLLLALTTAALAQQHSNVPVVLVDDCVEGAGDISVSLGCSVQLRGPSTNFGDLPQLLYRDTWLAPYYFEQGPDGYDSIEHLGSKFGQFLRNNAPALNTQQFDVVAYGLGGLIVRGYLARDGSSRWRLHFPTSIRQAVTDSETGAYRNPQSRLYVGHTLTYRPSGPPMVPEFSSERAQTAAQPRSIARAQAAGAARNQCC